MVLPQPPHQSEAIPDAAKFLLWAMFRTDHLVLAALCKACSVVVSICSLLLPSARQARLPLLQAISELMSASVFICLDWLLLQVNSGCDSTVPARAGQEDA